MPAVPPQSAAASEDTRGRPAPRGTRVQSRAANVRFRRAMTLLLMTVVAPGSAQIAAGNKRVGRYALRAFLAALCFGAALVLTFAISRDTIIQLFTNVWFLGALR